MDNNIPRRIRIDQMVPAELAIRTAMLEVEKLPADVRLTQAVNLLGQAQEKVADFVDKIRPPVVVRPGQVWRDKTSSKRTVRVLRVQGENAYCISSITDRECRISLTDFTDVERPFYILEQDAE